MSKIGFPGVGRIIAIDRLDAMATPWSWPFVEQRRAEIDAYFQEECRINPALWNGRLFLLRDFSIADGVFRGNFFEIDYASMLAALEWGALGQTVWCGFAVAALLGSDQAFVVGTMAPHTRTNGYVVFPSGSVEPPDVVDGKVDMLGSVCRELEEETGISAKELAPERGWYTLIDGPRVPLFKIMRADVPAETLRMRILKNLAAQERPEFSDVHIVRGPSDMLPGMPVWMTEFLAGWRDLVS